MTEVSFTYDSEILRGMAKAADDLGIRERMLEHMKRLEMPVSLHPSTFEYLKPTEQQLELMGAARQYSKEYAERLDGLLPDCADKSYILRRVRETAMWVNVCLTREADGTPRP